jgi:hypothetical protein
MEFIVSEFSSLYDEINNSGMSIEELVILGLKTQKIITQSHSINSEPDYQILNEIQKIQMLLGSSVNKGNISETIIIDNICKYFPDAEIIPIGYENNKGDILMLIKNIKIMIEVKNYKLNVPKKEVEKFHRDLMSNEYDSSIMISCNSGITGRKNKFSYEFIGNKFAVYICNGGNDGLSINWAILFILSSLKLIKKITNENENDINLIITFVENKLNILQNSIEDIHSINDNIIKMKLDITRALDISTSSMIKSLEFSKNKINDIIKSFELFIDSGKINTDLSMLYSVGQNEASLDELSLIQLRIKAKEMGLKSISKINKVELLKLIKLNY